MYGGYGHSSTPVLMAALILTPNNGLSRRTYYDGLSIGGTSALNGCNGPERLSGTDTENHEFSLNIEHEFGNGMTLTSVTGYSQYEFEDGIEADFLPRGIYWSQ